MNAIETQQLTKTYPGRRRIPLVRDSSDPIIAVRNVDLTVKEGEIFGFLGPNGAGKSTTINVLLDYITPTSGSVEVFGLDAQDDALEIHDRIGVLPEKLSLWPRLSARGHLRLASQAKDVDPNPEEVLERVELGDAIDRRVGDFSTGMTQRLGLAMALTGDPELLILDEPTAGLDPNGVRRLREIIWEEADRGATVFFSSHVLDQVEAICDRVGILRDGELVAVDTIDGLRKTVDASVTLTIKMDEPLEAAHDSVCEVDGVSDATLAGAELVTTCSSDSVTLDVLDAVRDAGATVEQFDRERRDLETLFDDLAGGEGDDTSESAGTAGRELDGVQQ